MNWRIALRPLFYGFALTVGLSLAFDQLSLDASGSFWTVILILVVLLLIEIFSSWLFHYINHPGEKIKLISTGQQWIGLMQHWGLPVITLLLQAATIYFNRQSEVRYLIYAVNWLIFSLLFANLRSQHDKDWRNERITHLVYDLLQIYIIFLFAHLTGLLTADGGLKLAATIGLGITAIMIMTTSTVRRHRTPLSMLTLGGALIIANTTIFIALSNMVNITALELGVVYTLMFYFVMAVVHHLVQKNLTLQLLGEYLLVTAIVLSVIINL